MRLKFKIGSFVFLCGALVFSVACMKSKNKAALDAEGKPCPTRAESEVRECLGGIKATQESGTCDWTCSEDQIRRTHDGDNVCPSLPRKCKDGSAATKPTGYGTAHCKQVCSEDKNTATTTTTDTGTGTGTASSTSTQTNSEPAMACNAIQRICSDGSNAVNDAGYGVSNCKQNCPGE